MVVIILFKLKIYEIPTIVSYTYNLINKPNYFYYYYILYLHIIFFKRDYCLLKIGCVKHISGMLKKFGFNPYSTCHRLKMFIGL